MKKSLRLFCIGLLSCLAFSLFAVSNDEIVSTVKKELLYSSCEVYTDSDGSIKAIMGYNHSEIAMGDSWELLIAVYSSDQSYGHDFPFVEDKVISNFAIQSVEPLSFQNDSFSLAGFILTLSPVRPGKVSLDNLSLEYWDVDLPAEVNQMDLPAINLVVKGVLSDEEYSMFRELDLPELTIQKLFYANKYLLILLAVALVLIISVSVIAFKKCRRKKNEPLYDPFQNAYDALRGLRESALESPDEVRIFFYELSNILRHFIEDVYGINAPDLTTDEFLSKIRDNQTLEKSHQKILRDFHNVADLVKYAKYHPPQDDVAHSYQTVIEFVENTKEIIRKQQMKEDAHA